MDDVNNRKKDASILTSVPFSYDVYFLLPWLLFDLVAHLSLSSGRVSSPMIYAIFHILHLDIIHFGEVRLTLTLTFVYITA